MWIKQDGSKTTLDQKEWINVETDQSGFYPMCELTQACIIEQTRGWEASATEALAPTKCHLELPQS